MDPLQYEAACKYVGKLYLESNRQLEAQAITIQELRQELQQLKQERDDALRLLPNRREN